MSPGRRGQVNTVVDQEEPSAKEVVRRAPWWFEVAVLAGGYLIYSWVADQAPRGAALAHGRAILRFEKAVRINVEHSLNHFWTTKGHSIIVAGNVYYDLMHFIVPVGTLLWVYFFRHEVYRRVRTPLVVVSLVALAVFWLWPTAPPRLIPELGLYDTIARVHTLGGGGSHGITASENPFAALPSLHVAWATWSAYAVWSSTRNWVARGLLALHVAVMAFLVVATGNHWVSDVLAGASGVLVSVLLSYGVAAAWRTWRAPTVSATERVPASIDDARR
jgi:membrane-associated phospholipid phosphatase